MSPNKNPTQWIDARLQGTVGSVTDVLQAQAGDTLTTQSGTNIDLNPNLITPEPHSSWTAATRVTTSWLQPQNTTMITVGTELFIDNLGNFLVTNGGDNLVTTTTYQQPKYATAWSEAAAA